MAPQILAPGFELTCPIWVQFLDAETSEPYFYNVLTHERSPIDPDPSGELCCRAPEAANISYTACSLTEKSEHGRTLESAVAAIAADWRSHPARVQVPYDPTRRTQYVEGFNEYNIWYGKYENDRHDRKDKEPASYRLNPSMDCGWTKANLKGAEKTFFCIYFAQGCCSRGSTCTYHHHIPTPPDGETDMVHDIFGRVRYSQHRDDMGGVGSFNAECKTLFVADLVFEREKNNALQLVEQQIWDDFGMWGDIEEVRVIPTKALAFVRFYSRAAAEFAKVAMANQRLGISPLITVKWANADPDSRVAKRRRDELTEQADQLLEQRIRQMKLTEMEIASLKMQATNVKSFVAPYPDTTSQYAGLGPKTALQIAVGKARETEAAREAAKQEAEKAAILAEQIAMDTNMARLSSALSRIPDI